MLSKVSTDVPILGSISNVESELDVDVDAESDLDPALGLSSPPPSIREDVSSPTSWNGGS
jgi:hypothetical protein